jgi:hypothetical protein
MTGEAGEQLFEDYPLSGQSVAAIGCSDGHAGVLHLAIIARRCRYVVFPP